MVTNDLALLPSMDYIVLMQEGKIVRQGEYKKLSDEGINFYSLLSGIFKSYLLCSYLL